MPDIAAFREKAWQAFEQAGLPSTRQEEWKYTSLARLGSTLGETWWTPAGATQLGEADMASIAIPGLDAWRVVFADGRLVDSASSLPAGVSLAPLSELLASNGEQAAAALQWQTDAPLYNGAVAANSALAQDGICLSLADGIKLDRPIYMLHVNSNPGAAHLRHALILGRESSAHVIEHYAGVNEAPGLTHAVTLVRLAEAAELAHDRLQDESLKQFHLGRLDVTQERNSRFTSHAIALGASLCRLDVAVDLAGPGASCRLNGLYMPTGRQHSDQHTQIDHHAAHCTSRELYRGVLDGRAHGVFNGKVVVHSGASGTDSAQSNANLLLSDKAEIDAKPELVIHHDDVKAAHGCTVGQLDDKQLFYLKSRGMSDEQARQMLTFAFADAVLTSISQPALRRFIEKAAFSKLPLDMDAEALIG